MKTPFVALLAGLMASSASAAAVGGEVAVSCPRQGILLGRATLVESNSTQIIVTTRSGDRFVLNPADTLLLEPRPLPAAAALSAPVTATNPAPAKNHDLFSGFKNNLEADPLIPQPSPDPQFTYAEALKRTEQGLIKRGASEKDRLGIARVRKFLELHPEIGAAPPGTIGLFSFRDMHWPTGTKGLTVFIDDDYNYKLVRVDKHAGTADGGSNAAGATSQAATPSAAPNLEELMKLPVAQRNTYWGRQLLGEVYLNKNGSETKRAQMAQLHQFLIEHPEIAGAPVDTFSTFQFPDWCFKTGDSGKIVLIDKEGSYKLVEMAGK